MNNNDSNKGLTEEQVIGNRLQYGSNCIELKEDRVLLQVLKEIVMEPMFILLMAACIIYFIAGQYREGIIMGVSIFIVAGISLFQEYRSKNAIKALKKIAASKALVIRNGIELKINTEDVLMCIKLPETITVCIKEHWSAAAAQQ